MVDKICSLNAFRFLLELRSAEPFVLQCAARGTFFIAYSAFEFETPGLVGSEDGSRSRVVSSNPVAVILNGNVDLILKV